MFEVLPFAKYVYDDRASVFWEPYADPDYIRTEIHIGEPGFVPSPSSLVSVIPDQTVDHYEIKELEKFTEYEAAVLIITELGQEDGRVHITTADEDEVQLIHDGGVFGGWGQLNENEVGTIICFVLPTAGHGGPIDPNADLSYHYRMISHRNVPIFTIEKISSRENIIGQQNHFDPPGIKTPVLFMMKADGVHYVFADDTQGKVWDFTKSKLLIAQTSPELQPWASAWSPIVLSDGSWLVSLSRRNYTVYAANHYITDSYVCRITFDELGDMVADEPVLVKASDKEYYGYYGGQLVKIPYPEGDPRNTYPNEHIVGIIRTNDVDQVTWKYAAEPWTHVPMMESEDSGQTWTVTNTNIQITGWCTPILKWYEPQRRLYMANGNRLFPPGERSGMWLFWNDSLLPNEWNELQITNDNGADGMLFGEPDIAIIPEKEEMWFVAYRGVGIPKSEGGTSNPYVFLKLIDISGAVPTIKPIPKYNYESDPYNRFLGMVKINGHEYPVYKIQNGYDSPVHYCAASGKVGYIPVVPADDEAAGQVKFYLGETAYCLARW